jgi:hypothetical protein
MSEEAFQARACRELQPQHPQRQESSIVTTEDAVRAGNGQPFAPQDLQPLEKAPSKKGSHVKWLGSIGNKLASQASWRASSSFSNR